MAAFPQSSSKPIIRCSELEQLLGCAGSRTLKQHILAQLGPDAFARSGDAMTWRGNYCHYRSAKRLIDEFGATCPDGLEPPVLAADWTPVVWDDRSADWFVESVLGDTADDWSLFVEHRITVEFDRFVLTGQIDCYGISPDGDLFQIDDQKTGPVPVTHAEENWQLAGYATLLKKMFPRLRGGDARIRQRGVDEEVTSVHVDDLDAVVAYLEDSINSALDRALELETGYKQCRFCPAHLICPALRKEIARMKHLLSSEEVKALKVTPDLMQLGVIARDARAIKGPCERIVDTFKEQLEAAGGSIVLPDGQTAEIVEKPGPRTITNPKVAHALATHKLGDEDDAWKAMEVSLGELEDQLVKVAGMQRTSKKPDVETAQSWIRNSLAHITVRSTQKQLQFS